MVDMDREQEIEREHGDKPKRAKKTPRVRGSDIEREQAGRVARSQQPDSTAKEGFTRWDKT